MNVPHSGLLVKCLIGSLCVLSIISAITMSQVVKSFIELKHKSEYKTPVDEYAQKFLDQRDALNLIPTRYAVDKSFLLPPSNQARRGVCWIFATLFMLESQYRANGIKKGFLKENQYVTFSKQAYGAYLGNNCKENPSLPVCKHGGLGKPTNDTDDQLVDSIYYFQKAFPKLNASILPETVCPYIEEGGESTDFKCDGMNEAIKQNPIGFNIKSYNYAVNVNNTKRLLYKAKRPLGIGVPIGENYFFAPCDSSSYSTDDECVKQTTPCPAGYQAKFCKKVTIEGRIYDGTFSFINDANRSSFLGVHEMDIVGYNDEWVYTSKWDTDKSMALMKGGFILHNSWREVGHSVDFLLGKKSYENEMVTCPNHKVSQYWIPVSYSCFQEKKDVSQCLSGSSWVRGKANVNKPDLLKCTNEKFCDTNLHYVLAYTDDEGAFTVQHLFSGLDLTRMATIDADGNVNTILYDKLPFHYLGRVFQPIDVVDNNQDDCGYFMFPYDAIDMLQRKDWDKLDYFHSSDIEFEFPDYSYAANKAKYPQYNYTLLEQSTHEWNPVPFDGPLPYQYVF
ncbi:hypothetical protein TVAG_430280 [Trichomonas vaginalis G3]|uniref:Peptidase C1A papain C-terminal domain-containing protein n=1 Tax=Trichomonas vaginalis (strain ATCC PRA-98 / G3) TaxID=412133 RepID=A2E354_TRIV3|nr:papain family cysteine protease domain containing protein family [Trichomonas vaginalis G3]EAY12864.1 hypothetical protein TVAG_430280 [Trichomonas vaginalis G3]KAI5491971.1 papain family cysteine protease domain containing protein family [Trichomonas vaginalis G3]|eukprot:XP_001325087.1 hypothetical protein [Trichomonas vaginalis G3]